MKNPILTTFACIALLAGLVLTAPAQAQCVPFQGIDHCPVGAATLSQGPNGLTVSGLGSEGNDGVVSRFDPTTFWNAQVALPGGGNASTHFLSISAGEVTSELFIEPVDGRLRLQATFTGDAETPSYSVLIYKNGILQGSLGGFAGDPNGGGQVTGKASSEGGLESMAQRIALYVDGIYMGQIEEPWWWPWVTFGIANNGGCNWGFGLSQPATFSLPDGRQVEGDEVRFMEDVRGPGHYPYLGFEAIETRSTGGSFTVMSEMAEGAR